MTNINNISEYQKIIFANGIDESNISYDGGIWSLSKKYPFVVFITKKSDFSEYNVDNIWFDGVRLTRFIGIDSSHNTLQIGDHTLALKFDYESGLLGIFDENELNTLSIETISYENYSYNGALSQRIFSKNNTFKITFKYQIQDNGSNSNIQSISKALNFNPSLYFDKISESNEGVDTSNTIQYYSFTYKIKKPLLTLTDFIFTSNYSSDKNCKANLILYLNPESYILSLKDQNNSSSIISGDTINLDQEESYLLNFDFTPLVNSNVNHQIYVDLGNTSSLTMVGNITNKTIINGNVSFSFITPKVTANSTKTIKLSITIYCIINSNERINYTNLNKTLTINIKGEETNKFFYFGYSDPRLDSTKLVDYSSKDIGNYEFTGNEIEANEIESYYNGKYFYLAIPLEYSDVLPRWYAWFQNSSNANDKSTPLVCTSWFNIINTRFTKNGIDFKIYQRKVTGKFYGFVK